MDFFDWVDFFLDPYHICMMGLLASTGAYAVTGSLMYTFGVERKLGLKLSVAIAVLVGLIVWGLGYGVVLWYNTPLGSPLELTRLP